MDKTDGVEARVEALLKRMSLKEKVSLLSGRDMWRTASVARQGIPSLVMTDGPHGVRTDGAAERFKGPATSFPTGVSMASCWDTGLVERVGAALGEEARGMGCDILLGPCVNIVRGPLAGRNFESYSEDPYHAGRIAVSYITGLQSRGVGASLKHFALNNQETERGRGSSRVDERTMREIYLPQFELAVKEARPWTVMCAYNRVNGTYASENRYLLTEILREEWGFQGVVISDWGANHSTVESLRAGLDIEMPGPAAYFGKQMEEAVQNWQVDERQVDEAVRRILLMVIRSGRMDAPSRIPPGSVNTPGHQELARELAEQSIVLLRNEGDLLPLDAAAIGSIAVIGPNAAECRIGGGGSSFVAPPHTVSPLDGIRKRLGGRVETAYAKGCTNLVEPALMSKGFFPGKNDGPAGLTAEYFPHPDFTGTAVKLVGQESEFLWFGTGPEAGISVTEFSARLTGTLTVPVSDAYRISMSNNGRCRLLIDGKLVLDNDRGNLSYTVIWAHPVRIAMSATVELTEGNAHEIKIEYVKTQAGPDVELFTGQEFALMRLCYMPPEHPEGINEAAALAARCDAAVVCVGMPTGFESEGRDRPHMNLPGEQDDLVCAVLKANPRTVVVLNTGSPVALPWVQEAPALLQAFYMGQEGGHALASVIFGDVNPSGRLSVTYPKRLEDNPSFLDFPGSKEVFYGEGIFVGYRYYDTKDIEPLFPFGFGLSYTSFQYSRLGAPLRAERGTPVKVSVDVRNTGKRAGKEIVQLYVRDVQSSLARPPKELKGFSAIELQPGETRTLDFFLDSRAFSFYDPHEKRWIVEPGEFEILVGSSSRDIRLKKSVILQ